MKNVFCAMDNFLKILFKFANKNDALIKTQVSICINPLCCGGEHLSFSSHFLTFCNHEDFTFALKKLTVDHVCLRSFPCLFFLVICNFSIKYHL